MSRMLEIEHLCKYYPGFSLQDVNISLDSGYIMGFIGPNGAGKTTTIKLIMNLIRRDAGSIRVFGLDNLADEVPVKERIGFVYEESCYYEHLTIGEMQRIIRLFYKNWDDPVFRDYIERFELPWKKKIKELSRGMKMKLSLAVALSHHADLIIMDEPRAALSTTLNQDFQSSIREFFFLVVAYKKTAALGRQSNVFLKKGFTRHRYRISYRNLV